MTTASVGMIAVAWTRQGDCSRRALLQNTEQGVLRYRAALMKKGAPFSYSHTSMDV